MCVCVSVYTYRRRKMSLHFALVSCLLLHSALSQRYGLQPQRPAYNPTGGGGGAGGDILTQISDVRPDGSFYTKWETANGIAYEEQGQLLNRGAQNEAGQVQGSASWRTNEGESVSISWQADENGAVFQGDHLPTPPPAPEIPPLIQRALDWLAANPSKYDDEGQYREDDGAGVRAQQLVPRRPPPRRF